MIVKMEVKKRFKTYKIIMLVILVAFITFLCTSIGMYQYFLNKNGDNFSIWATTSSNSDIATTLNKYKSIINKYYLGEVDEEKLKEGAIKGYIEGLEDPYTEYISKEDMQDYLDDTMGNFVGIGIYMVKNTEVDKIQVLAPIKNSPAEKAGILPGDLIIAVDDVQYTADDMTEVSAKIKGEEGTNVKVEILRGTETKTFALTRETIKVNPVEGKVLNNHIGYIEFSSFDEGTAEDFKAKYEELQKQGIDSLIIDLRNNGGGIVDEAVDIADLMIEKGKNILITKSKNEEEEETKAQKDRTITVPVVVLVNEYSASASEILAAALKENDNATLVGKKTYGKGVIQTVYSMNDGSGLKLTTEEYFTPNHNKIHEIGITPDVEIDLPEGKTLYDVEDKEDTQLQKAIELLK